MRKVNKKLYVILPVYNDFASCLKIVKQIRELKLEYILKFVIIDDASTEDAYSILNELNLSKSKRKSSTSDVSLIRLESNRGNAYSIWVGLNFVYAKVSSEDRVVVMDSDGEDNPNHIPLLVNRHQYGIPTVAKRGKRKNSRVFKVWHVVFKIAFKYLTNKAIDFGNFSVIDLIIMRRLFENEKTVFKGYVGGLLATNSTISRVELDRNERYFGQSKVNVEQLMKWGVMQASPLVDDILSKIMKLSIKASLLLFVVAVLLMIIRILDIAVLPGWTSIMMSLLFLGSIQVILFAGLFLAQFLILDSIQIKVKQTSINVSKKTRE